MNKTLVTLTLLALCVAACNQQPSSSAGGTHTYSSFDSPSAGGRLFAARAITFQDADVAQVLNLYAEVSGRSLIRGGTLPSVKVTFCNQAPMTTVEVLRALDTVLAAQDITTVYQGTQYVKVVPAGQAIREQGPVLDCPPDQLPDSSSYLTYIVKVKRVRPSEAVPALAPFSNLQGSIIAVDPGLAGRPPAPGILTNLPGLFGGKDTGLLIFRDYSANVRRMVQMLEKLEKR